MIYIWLKKILDKNGTYIASFDNEIEKLMHTWYNCQSFLQFKIKGSFIRDYVM